MTISIRNLMGVCAAAGAAMTLLAFTAQPASADMSVNELTLTSGVANREPVDTVTEFKPGDSKAFIFARIKNTDAPAKVNFVWYLDDVERARVAMTIGTSARWRTWTSSNIGPGKWRVDMVDEAGKVLAQKKFIIGVPATAAASPAASPAAAPSIAETPASQPGKGGATSQ